jgi:hypothetical protein
MPKMSVVDSLREFTAMSSLEGLEIAGGLMVGKAGDVGRGVGADAEGLAGGGGLGIAGRGLDDWA